MKKILLLIITWGMVMHGMQAQLSQDTCLLADAAVPIITGDGVYTVDGIDGSEVPMPICAENGANADKGEWYKYVPTSDTQVTITSDLPQNNGTDTRLHVYTGSCAALVCLDGDDDGGSGWTSYLQISVVADETYYIAWDNNWTSAGFDFELTEGAGPTPEPPITFTNTAVTATGSDRAVVDMNNDKLDDLVSVTTTNININYQLPAGGFNSVNIATSTADNAASWSLAAGDIDGNGYNDLLYGGGSGVTFMYANSDGTAYTEVSGPDYVFSQRSNFVDINNDGDLDAFVCHDIAPNVYYINQGDVSGTLTFYQGASMGVVPNGLGTHANGGNYGTVWIDFDNDRDMDMFIAKCRGGSVTHKYNELWRNDGSGTFVNVADGSGYYASNFPTEGHDNSSNLGHPIQTWSSAWADFDNDGDMDVYVGASSDADGDHMLMINNGDGTFTDSGQTFPSAPFGIENAPGDFDNDGWVDILTNGSILFNNGDGTFTLQSSGMPPSGPIGDVNNDGFLDVFNGNVRMNDADNGNNWIKITTEGTTSNINGIGARVEVTSSGLGKQIRDVRSGEGFRYMSSLNTHFGLGADTSISTVTVYWPSGTVDVVSNPPINSTLNIVEGTTLSLEDTLVSDLVLYPNPTKDVLNLNATYGFENAIYTVFDINGRRVMNGRFNTTKIDVSALSAGNYILRIMDEGLIRSQKFIKQ